MLEDCNSQVGATGKASVDCRDADAGPVCDFLQTGRRTMFGEQDRCSGHDPVAVALRIGAQFGGQNSITPRMFFPARRSRMASLMSSSLYFCVTSSSSFKLPASYIDRSLGMASRGFISP